MNALVADAENRTATLSILPVPTPGPNELLISVRAIAFNPVDTVYPAHPDARSGRTVGSDFADLVVARGPPAADPSQPTTASGRAPPLHCDGPAPPRRPSPAASASPASCRAPSLSSSCARRIWSGASRATAVSLCGLMAAHALFFRLGLDAPFQWVNESDGSWGNESDEGLLERVQSETGREESDDDDDAFSFFVHGASTSVGLYAAQLVRRSAEVSGSRVRLVGVAHPRNWDMLKTEPYGYDILVDSRSLSWPEHVLQATGGGEHFAYDAISGGLTVRGVSSILRHGGKMAVLRWREAGAWHMERTMGPWHFEGLVTEPFYGGVWEGFSEDLQNEDVVWLSDGGLLHPNPVRVMPGGLDKVVEDGFELLGTRVPNRCHDRIEHHMRPIINGEKLVYTVEAERRGSVSTGDFRKVTLFRDGEFFTTCLDQAGSKGFWSPN